MQLHFGAPALSSATEIALDAVPLAVVRYRGVTLSDLGRLFDEAHRLLQGAVAAGAITQTGPLLGLYLGDPMAAFDLDVGFAVTEAFAPIDSDGSRIEAITAPAGAAMGMTHLGPYSELGAAWGRLMPAVFAAGRKPRTPAISIEIYVSDPERDDERPLRTDLVLPI